MSCTTKESACPPDRVNVRVDKSISLRGLRNFVAFDVSKRPVRLFEGHKFISFVVTVTCLPLNKGVT